MPPQFPRIFLWHVVRHLAAAPAAGCVERAQRGLGRGGLSGDPDRQPQRASQSFAAGIDLVAGKAQLEVRGDVDETLWPLLARQPGVKAVTGLVEGMVTFPDWPGEYLQVLGVDLFSGEAVPHLRHRHQQGSTPPLERWMGESGQLALHRGFRRAARAQDR